jgi:hypothetical protein
MFSDISKKVTRRFLVFSDADVGIDKASQKMLISSEMDDDC